MKTYITPNVGINELGLTQVLCASPAPVTGKIIEFANETPGTTIPSTAD